MFKKRIMLAHAASTSRIDSDMLACFSRVFLFSYATDRPGIFRVSYAAVDICAAPPHARYRAFEALELVAANSLPCRVFLVSRMAFVGLALSQLVVLVVLFLGRNRC